MRVGHLCPFGAQDFGLGRVCLGGLGGRARRQIQRLGLFGQVQLGDQAVKGRHVAFGFQMDLVDRIARRVEDLDRAFAPFVQREGMHPVAGKDPQVDLGTQHHLCMPARVIGLIGAAPFDHAAFIARQRHHVAQCRDQRHQRVWVRRDPGRASAHLRGHKIGLAQPVLGGEIAGAQLGRSARRARIWAGDMRSEVEPSAAMQDPFAVFWKARIWREAGPRAGRRGEHIAKIYLTSFVGFPN